MATLLDQATTRLQEQGGRMTEQRRLILETLDSLSGHPTAEELLTLVQERQPDLHLSTVYRTLRWLQAEGLVSSRFFAEERRQERFDPQLPSEHHHFVCLSCQRVIEFVEPLMVEGIRTQFEAHTGAVVQSAALVFYGLCASCRMGSELCEAETDSQAYGRSG